MSEKYLPQADQVKCFFLTSPFIEPAMGFVVSQVPKCEGPGHPSFIAHGDLRHPPVDVQVQITTVA